THPRRPHGPIPTVVCSRHQCPVDPLNSEAFEPLRQNEVRLFPIFVEERIVDFHDRRISGLKPEISERLVRRLAISRYPQQHHLVWTLGQRKLRYSVSYRWSAT